MAVQRHVVVIPTTDGGVELRPMKEWLKQHPDQMPKHLDPNPGMSNSHRIRSGLRKMGWTMEVTPTEVRLLAPGVKLDEVLGPPAEDDEDESPYFSLEYQLRDFLADNLGVIKINGRKLTLYEDKNGDGVEYDTPVGPIDILAVDDKGAFFVFELKRASSPDRAVGQVARYMGWVKQTIGNGKDVYGVIVAKAISEKLKFARTVVPNVYLFEYEVSFTLKQAHDLADGHV
jgi:endonuclease